MGILDRFNPSIDQMKFKWDVNGLIRALKARKDWRERKAAAGALLEIRDARSVEPLIEALKDEREEVREAAAATLGAVVVLGAVETSGQAAMFQLGDQAHGMVRFDAMRYKRAVGAICHALKDSSEHVRWGAARALGIIRNTDTVVPLTEALSDDSEQVRQEAAAALEKIKHAETVLKPDTPAVELQLLVLRDLVDLGCELE
jgi:HEAT repeat protein